MIGAVNRGLPLSMFDEMNVGQIIDYCIAYQNAMNDTESDDRIAVQRDFDSF